MLAFEAVESALEDDLASEQNAATEQPDNAVNLDLVPAYHAEIAKRIKEWIENEGYTTPGLTLKQLAEQLCTNRTYLSEYINTVYHVSFRDWITDLRIDFAKRRIKAFPQQKILEISETSGFMSLSHFTKTFSEKEGCSPARWRKSLGD